jgi:hypothetical protein
MTTYDTYGRPVQSIDPGLALAGVAAAGIIGYAAANDNSGHRGHRRVRTVHHTNYNQGFCDDGFGGGYGHGGGLNHGFGGGGCGVPVW